MKAEIAPRVLEGRVLSGGVAMAVARSGDLVRVVLTVMAGHPAAGLAEGETGVIAFPSPVTEKLLTDLHPALLLITLGELGMLLCQRGQQPFHIPTVAQEVFDVSGAGDTVIASFTLAIAAGASPLEAALLSNYAAGIVVGKVGTAITTPAELIQSFKRH